MRAETAAQQMQNKTYIKRQLSRAAAPIGAAALFFIVWKFRFHTIKMRCRDRTAAERKNGGQHKFETFATVQIYEIV